MASPTPPRVFDSFVSASAIPTLKTLAPSQLTEMMHITVKMLSGEVCSFDVNGDGTVKELKSSVAEKTSTPADSFALYRGKTYLAVVKALGEAGVVDGDLLYARPCAAPKHRAETRINRLGVRPKRGGAACSIRHDVRAAKEDVIDEVAVVGHTARACHDILTGVPVPRTPGQTDGARMKQLRLQKRAADNELCDLREREGNRLSKRRVDASLAVVAEAGVAQGAVQLVLDVATREELDIKKQELADYCKARKKMITAREKQFRAAEHAAGNIGATADSAGSAGAAAPAGGKRAKRARK